MREEMIKMLMNEMKDCTCDNCEYDDYWKYGERCCCNCKVQYNNWSLSEKKAAELVDKILKNGDIA